jgi:GT2 family glycosyltransferase
MGAKVGIVLLNWNGWRDTVACLQSLRTLDYVPYEVYLVDNASEDDSEFRLRQWDPQLRIIQAGGNLGWAGGCNVGIRAALAEGCAHVYLLNNDAVRATRYFIATCSRGRPARCGSAGFVDHFCAG